MERLRHEIIDEYFFEMPVWDENGNIIPAPPEVLSKYDELRENWMIRQPNPTHEKAGVSLYSIYKGPRQGYVVATQIVYKPNTLDGSF